MRCNRYRIHALIGLAGCMLLSCRQEEVARPETTQPVSKAELVGVWVEQRNGEDQQINQRTLRFTSADSVVITETALDKTSGELLGYHSIRRGTYGLIPPGRSVTFSFTALYQPAPISSRYARSLYVDRQALQLKADQWESTRSLKLNDRKDTLTLLAPPCNDTGNCAVGIEVYVKQ